ncbi:MAG: 4Fe-4S binding protein [Pseudomonadota bacterium]
MWIKSSISRWRTLCQGALGTLLPNAYFKAFQTGETYQGVLKGVCLPGLNCYACPTTFCSCAIGTIQNFAASHQIPFFIIGYLGLIGLAVGRMACGWLCPFGWLQDILYKLKTKKITLPMSCSYFKYFFLIVLTLALPFSTGENWFSMFCPLGALEGTIPWAVWNPQNPYTQEAIFSYANFGFWFWTKIILLAFFLVTFIIIKRPFCRMFCPLGAIYSLFNRYSIIRLTVDSKACTGCNTCKNVCPVDLAVYENPNHPDCIRCLKCTQCVNIRIIHVFSHEKQDSITA